MNKNNRESIYIVSKSGEAVKVKLDLANNYIRSLQKGGVRFLRKLGWNIGKIKRRSLNDYKRERIFGSGKEKSNMQDII